jgi:ketosteroid isomerase-like protein
MRNVVRTGFGPDVRLPMRRSFDERFFVRWPAAYAALLRIVFRRPPRSRLRRSLLRLAVLKGWGAWRRDDLDVLLLACAPDYRFEPPPEWLAAGMRSVYSGHAGLRDWAADMREAWETIDVTPLEILDAGDVTVVLARTHLRARGSGVEFDEPLGLTYRWSSGGLIRHQRDFLDWDRALSSAGIDAAAVSGPSRQQVTSSRNIN